MEIKEGTPYADDCLSLRAELSDNKAVWLDVPAKTGIRHSDARLWISNTGAFMNVTVGVPISDLRGMAALFMRAAEAVEAQKEAA